MKSDEIIIKGNDVNIQSIIAEVNKVADYYKIDPKKSIRLQLLAEELIGVEKGIMGYPTGVFYVETKNDEIMLCLSIESTVDYLAQEKFLELSKSGKNEATKGIGGKIRYIVNWMFSGCGTEYASTIDYEGVYSGLYSGHVPGTMYDMGWSLTKYRDNAQDDKDAWDELEMSIIGKLADDVLVGASNNKIEIKIITKM